MHVCVGVCVCVFCHLQLYLHFSSNVRELTPTNGAARGSIRACVNAASCARELVHTVTTIVNVCECVYVGSQAAHRCVIAASEFAALDYCNLLPRECRALWENREQECVHVHVCVCVCVLALWEKRARPGPGHNTAFSLPSTSMWSY